MKYSHIIKLSLVLAAIFLLSPTRTAAAAQGPASQVASMLSGTHQFRDENSDVRLQIGSTSSGGSTVEMLVTASGRYNGRDIRQQGIVRLVSEGPDVQVTVIPHFAPVTETSPDVNRFSETELRASCTLYLQPDDGRWFGATEGSGTCVQAVTGAAGQWKVEIGPGTLRFVDAGTKQALVFQKTRDSVGR